jgi:hypothetical protein
MDTRKVQKVRVAASVRGSAAAWTRCWLMHGGCRRLLRAAASTTPTKTTTDSWEAHCRHRGATRPNLPAVPATYTLAGSRASGMDWQTEDLPPWPCTSLCGQGQGVLAAKPVMAGSARGLANFLAATAITLYHPASHHPAHLASLVVVVKRVLRQWLAAPHKRAWGILVDDLQQLRKRHLSAEGKLRSCAVQRWSRGLKVLGAVFRADAWGVRTLSQFASSKNAHGLAWA